MTETQNRPRATPTQIRNYFGRPADTDPAGMSGVYQEVPAKELIELRKLDAAGFDQIANGIGDGSLTY